MGARLRFPLVAFAIFALLLVSIPTRAADIVLKPITMNGQVSYQSGRVSLEDNAPVKLVASSGQPPFTISPSPTCGSILTLVDNHINQDPSVSPQDLADLLPIPNTTGSCDILIKANDGSTTNVSVTRATSSPGNGASTDPIKQAAISQTAGLINIAGPALGAGVVLIIGAAAKKGETVINNFGPTPSPAPTASAAAIKSLLANLRSALPSAANASAAPRFTRFVNFRLLAPTSSALNGAAIYPRSKAMISTWQRGAVFSGTFQTNLTRTPPLPH